MTRGWLEGQQVGGCPVFPRNNIWNTPVDTMPVHASSLRYIESSGPGNNLHPDFSGNGGIPINIVPGGQQKLPVILESAESDPGPYPIPVNPLIESGTDSHMLIVEQSECRLYEMFLASRSTTGAWLASSGAIFDLRRNLLRPDGWTSADAAGLPILAGLVRYEEIAAGEIRHAVRITVPRTRREYVWPARHFASRTDNAAFPPMGQRFRLKASYDISGFNPEVQVLLRALKKYGAMVSDNGTAWFITGATDSRWNDGVWAQLKQVKGSDLEAVDVSALMISPNSAQAGVVSTVGRNEVPFSNEPAFDAQGGTAQTILLTGDVMTSSVTNLGDGMQISFLICQDAIGGRIFTWPANVRGGMRVGTAPGTCSAQQFVSDGRGLYATTPGMSDLAAVE